MLCREVRVIPVQQRRIRGYGVIVGLAKVTRRQGSKQEFDLVCLDPKPSVLLYLTHSASAKATSGNTHLASLKTQEHQALVATLSSKEGEYSGDVYPA